MRAFLEEAEVRREGRALEPTREALRTLVSYPWPGNVRELRAEVMRWGVFCDERVDVGDLAPQIRAPAAPRALPPGRSPAAAPPVTLAEAVEAAERATIGQALDAHGNNLSRAARALGIDRNTLKRKMSRYGLRELPESGA